MPAISRRCDHRIAGIDLVVVNLYPFAASLYYSLTQYSIISTPVWIGLTNYQNLFTQDPEFWTSLGNTVYYTVFAVGAGTLLAAELPLPDPASLEGEPK